MAEAVYVVRTTFQPTVQLRVSRTEYDRLTDQGLVLALDEVIAARDDIVVTPTEPVNPVVGLIWHNPAIPT